MWGLVLALLIAIFIAGFASLNGAPVSVNFLLWQAPEVSLAIVILVSVLVGVVIAALSGTSQYVRNMQRTKELEAKVKELEGKGRESVHEGKKEPDPA